MIKINTSGDYVQLIYVDPVQESVQQELKSDTDAFECSYDSEGKLYLQFGLMRFENPDPTDFIVNDVAVTDAADFISKLNALFTGGGGGGSSLLPTTGTGTATGDITGDLNGHNLTITGEGPLVLIEVETDEEVYSSVGIGRNDIDGSTLNSVYLYAEIEAEGKKAAIYAQADETDSAYITMNAVNGADDFKFNVYSDGISTNTGSTKWTLGAAAGTPPTPDSNIIVTINGVQYKIAAEQVVD